MERKFIRISYQSVDFNFYQIGFLLGLKADVSEDIFEKFGHRLDSFSHNLCSV